MIISWEHENTSFTTKEKFQNIKQLLCIVAVITIQKKNRKEKKKRIIISNTLHISILLLVDGYKIDCYFLLFIISFDCREGKEKYRPNKY